MSRQQINLYQIRAQDSGLSLNAVTMAIALIAVTVLLAALVWWQSVQRDDLMEHLADLKSQEAHFADQVQSLHARLPADQSVRLAHERQQLEGKLLELQQIRKLIAQQKISASTSFADQLSGLAQHHPNGIALTEILFLANGNHIELRGDARPAEIVPQYLQQLQADQRFQNTQFGPLHMQRDKSHSDIVNFQLSKAGATP